MSIEKETIEIMKSLGETLINDFDRYSTVETGLNGPYNDKETEVRNLSHLIVLTSIKMMCGESGLKEVLRDMGKKLISFEQTKGIYILREKKGKDFTNGVIGSAWVIEAYVYLYRSLKENIYLEKALDISERYKFNDKLGLWRTPSVKNRGDSIDFTFNHQLWFAASIAELYQVSNDPTLLRQCNIFMTNLDKNFNTSKNGLIVHSIIRRENLYLTSKQVIKKSLDNINRLLNRKSYKYKEIGYQSFNVFAFARLREAFPSNEIWKNRKIIKSIELLNKNCYFDELLISNYNKDKSLNEPVESSNINIYGFPYNVVGLEIFFIEKVFSEYIKRDTVFKFLKMQLNVTKIDHKRLINLYSPESGSVCYRIYEFYRGIEMNDFSV